MRIDHNVKPICIEDAVRKLWQSLLQIHQHLHVAQLPIGLAAAERHLELRERHGVSSPMIKIPLGGGAVFFHFSAINNHLIEQSSFWHCIQLKTTGSLPNDQRQDTLYLFIDLFIDIYFPFIPSPNESSLSLRTSLSSNDSALTTPGHCASPHRRCHFGRVRRVCSFAPVEGREQSLLTGVNQGSLEWGGISSPKRRVAALKKKKK